MTDGAEVQRKMTEGGRRYSSVGQLCAKNAVVDEAWQGALSPCNILAINRPHTHQRHRRAFNCYDVPASRGDYAPILFIYIFQ